MANQDTTQLKDKIVAHLRIRGPSLPAHVASATGLSMLFAGAFLSELATEKKIRISTMKVGSSPVYYLPEHHNRLESYAQHLKSKEKEAYEMLKEKSFLVDTRLEPAIRVALRAIRDFAIPFEYDGELVWRYVTVPKTDYAPGKQTPPAPKPELQKQERNESEQEERKEPEQSPETPSLEKREEPKPLPKKEFSKKTPRKKSKSTSKNDKFFTVVKDHLDKRGVDISGIIGFSKNDLILKIRKNSEELLLYAFNKRSLTEKDLMKAYKKATEEGLGYTVMFLGEPSKKLQTSIDAIKALDKVETIK